uniref:Uncharacterized protein n=1 Tax=Anopheles minimus TaxID=112268 RepID=A0A182VRL8_9DIPT
MGDKPMVHQIREENAWQVFQTGDCKVIQSKIEYYETSIHRTPLTGGGDGGDFFTSETTALCPHTAPLSTADSLEEMARSSTGSWHRQRTTSFGAGSDAPPKTSDTTCSSCCFCNPELHNHGGSMKSITDGCFYCRAKLGQSPTRSFPAPPTPPNIQTSPVPPSPQTPITELTPTPSLHEIAVPVRKSSLARPTGKDVKTTVPNVSSREDAPSKKCDGAAKMKHAKPPADAFSDKSSKRSTAKGSTTATVSTVTGSEEVPLKPLPPVPTVPTPKMTRKKPTEPGGGVLNRPKYTNNLTRASTVIQSVQKEIKNELRAPIRVLPKTAKEVNNRKEKERQIGLSLPKDYESRTRPPVVSVVEDEPMIVAGGSAETHGYDNETSSSDTSDGNSTADSSPNVSPFKRPNLQQQLQPESSQSTQPPTAATRWKTNSERNLSQLAIQKLVSASRWGSWTVTVAGNYNPEMAPDVEMRLSFPKGATGGGSGGKSALTSSAATGSLSHVPHTSSGSYTNSNGPSALTTGAGQNRPSHQYADGDGDHFDGVGYLGASRSTSRAGALPPTASQTPGPLNPRRNLTRSDGTGAGTTSKDYRLPNVGSTHNILARPTARKAIKVPERAAPTALVTQARKTQQIPHHQQQQQRSRHLSAT